MLITTDDGATVATDAPALLEHCRQELHEVNPEISLDLPSDRHLVDELGIDSLDLLEFVARLEYDFRFVVPDEDIDGLVTLDAVVAYMRARVADGGPPP